MAARSLHPGRQDQLNFESWVANLSISRDANKRSIVKMCIKHGFRDMPDGVPKDAFPNIADIEVDDDTSPLDAGHLIVSSIRKLQVLAPRIRDNMAYGEKYSQHTYLGKFSSSDRLVADTLRSDYTMEIVSKGDEIQCMLSTRSQRSPVSPGPSGRQRRPSPMYDRGESQVFASTRKPEFYTSFTALHVPYDWSEPWEEDFRPRAGSGYSPSDRAARTRRSPNGTSYSSSRSLPGLAFQSST